MVYQQTSGVTTLGDMHLWIDGDDLFALHISDLDVTLGLNGKTKVTADIPMTVENAALSGGELPLWDRLTPTMWAVLEVPFLRTTQPADNSMSTEPTSLYFSMILAKRPGESYNGPTPVMTVELDSAYTVMQDVVAGIGLQDATHVSVYQAIDSALRDAFIETPVGWNYTPSFLSEAGSVVTETLLSNRDRSQGATYTDDSFALVQKGLPESLDQIMQNVSGRVASRMVTGTTVDDDGHQLAMRRVSMFAEVDWADYVIGPSRYPGEVPGVDVRTISGYITMVANQLGLSQRGSTTSPSALIPREGTYTSQNPATSQAAAPTPDIESVAFDDTLLASGQIRDISMGVGQPQITSVLIGAQTTSTSSQESEITIDAGTKISDSVDLPPSTLPKGTILGYTTQDHIQVTGTLDEFDTQQRHVIINGKVDLGEVGKVYPTSQIGGTLAYTDASGLVHEITSSGDMPSVSVVADDDILVQPTHKASITADAPIKGTAKVATPVTQGHPYYMMVTDDTSRGTGYDTPRDHRMKRTQIVQLQGLTFPEDPDSPEHQAGVRMMRQVAQSMLYNQANVPSLTFTTTDPRFTAPGCQLHVGESMPSLLVARNLSTAGTFVVDTVDVTVGDGGTLVYKVSCTGYSGGNVPTLDLK